MQLRATRLTAIAQATRSLLSVFAGSAAAYSVRIPSGSTYNGPLLRVRRSSDNAEADIGAIGPQLALNRFFSSTSNWTLQPNVTITGGAMVVGSNVGTIAGQYMNLVAGRTYAVTLLVNKTGSLGIARVRVSTSSSLTTEGNNTIALSAASPPNGLSVYTATITANNPILVFASNDAFWTGSIFSVSVQDVNPLAGTEKYLNESALLAHVGVSSGFVTTWYDQSANNRNMTQTYAPYQPRIVNSGVVESGVYFDPTGIQDSVMRIASISTLFPVQSYNFVASYAQSLFQDYSATLVHLSTESAPATNISPAIGNVNSTNLFATIESGTFTMFKNGVQYTNINQLDYSPMQTRKVITNILSNPTSSTNWVFGSLFGNNWTGPINEIFIKSNQLTTAERQALERSQGAAFGITVA